MTELSLAEVRAAAHRLAVLADSVPAQLSPALARLPLPPTAFGALTEVYRWYDEAITAVGDAGARAREALDTAAADLAGFANRHAEADQQAATEARRTGP